MSETMRPDDYDYRGSQRTYLTPEPTTMSGWVGWIGFAGTMMVLLGTFHIIDGLVALFRDQYFLVGTSGLVVSVDYTTWGWVHLVTGIIIIIAAGVAVFTGKVWARAIGVVLAMMSAIINLSFMAAYPFWAVIMIAIDIAVMWALIVHGHEIRE